MIGFELGGEEIELPESAAYAKAPGCENIKLPSYKSAGVLTQLIKAVNTRIIKER